jgi:hypothetical protein
MHFDLAVPLVLREISSGLTWRHRGGINMRSSAMLLRNISNGRVCSSCRSEDVYRVRRAGIAVKTVCRVLDVRPYWCANCDNFFLAPKRPRPPRGKDDYGLGDRDRSERVGPPF